MEKETEFLINIVKSASKLITKEFTVNAKDDKGDLVTSFDFEIEKYLISQIKQSYPTFDIVSEEFNTKAELTKNCFVIDPIDGTVNFAHEIPLWGIQVACVKNGEVCSSVMFLPKLNELYYADKTGAYLNDERLHLKGAKFNKGIVSVEGLNKMPCRVRAENSGLKTRNYGCACLSYAWVASGKIDGFVFKNNKYWDYVPGLYLIKQAGGFVIDKNNCHLGACTKELASTLEYVCTDYPDDEIELRHK